MLYVTNKSGKPLEIIYCFKKEVFEVDKTEEITEQAAKDIFGYGVANKEPYLVSLGLIRLHSDLQEGLEKLAKFEITSEFPQQDRSLPSAVGVVPLRVERRAGGSSKVRAA